MNEEELSEVEIKGLATIFVDLWQNKLSTICASLTAKSAPPSICASQGWLIPAPELSRLK